MPPFIDIVAQEYFVLDIRLGQLFKHFMQEIHLSVYIPDKG